MLVALAMALSPPDEVKPNCDGSTIEMAKCMELKIGKATTRLQAYRRRAIARFNDEEHDPATAKAIEDAGVAFDAYRETYCGAVYQRWIEGTIRYAMDQSCSLRLIDDETHRVWEDFLGFIQDDATPLLPEPKPTK